MSRKCGLDCIDQAVPFDSGLTVVFGQRRGYKTTLLLNMLAGLSVNGHETVYIGHANGVPDSKHVLNEIRSIHNNLNGMVGCDCASTIGDVENMSSSSNLFNGRIVFVDDADQLVPQGYGWMTDLLVRLKALAGRAPIVAAVNLEFIRLSDDSFQPLGTLPQVCGIPDKVFLLKPSKNKIARLLSPGGYTYDLKQISMGSNLYIGSLSTKGCEQ